tara:strand:- start:223 stop:678 length:456 start_codon:yes stop_codon:yes gene_type:complete
MVATEHQLIGSTIHRVAQLIQQRINQEIVESGLTRLSWMATAHLEESDGLSITDLSNRLEAGNANTGQLVDRMEANGWLARKPSPADRRVQIVAPTKKAKQALRKLEPCKRKLQEGILQDLTNEERDLLCVLLERIKRRLSGIEESGQASR